MQFQFSDNDFGGEDALKNYFTSGLMDSYFHSLTLGYTGTMCAGPFRIPKRRERPLVNNAARERSRVKTLRAAFKDLQQRLPAVPPDTKLSKLDVLMLATSYIARLMSALQEDVDGSQIFTVNGCMHPVKAWSQYFKKDIDCMEKVQLMATHIVYRYRELKKWPMRTRLYGGMLSNTILNPRDHEDGFMAQTTYLQSQEEVYISQNETPQP